MGINPEAGYSRILDRYKEEGRYRQIPSYPNDGSIIDLGSNDYLGLGKKSKEFIGEFLNHFDLPSFTSSASRLLSTEQVYHNNLELRLRELYGKEILLYNSGYHANTGTISALNIPGTLFLCDKLVHASIIDGLAMSKADFKRWRHNDTAPLRRMLEQNASEYDRVIVVAESVYSMDGDIAPLEELVGLKKEYPNLMLYIDEAHAFGVFGERGLGLCEQKGILDHIDILVGTFGKAAASSGAFVATDATIRDFLVNNARSFIFSTALPPVCCAWTSFMLEKIIAMKKEREKLAETGWLFRQRIREITGESNPSESQIVPLPVGDNMKVLRLSSRLLENNIIAPAIRRPTVPPGSERIRFSLSLGSGNIQLITDIIEKTYKDL